MAQQTSKIQMTVLAIALIRAVTRIAHSQNAEFQSDNHLGRVESSGKFYTFYYK